MMIAVGVTPPNQDEVDEASLPCAMSEHRSSFQLVNVTAGDHSMAIDHLFRVCQFGI